MAPGPGGGSPPATTPPGTGVPVPVGGGGGSGGSGGSGGAGGAAGSRDAGTSGSRQDAGTAARPDAGGASDGAPGTSVDAGAAIPPCTVTITPVSHATLLDLPAGDGARLTVRAQATGPQAPQRPVWTWTVSSEPGGAVTATSIAGDPSAVQFPMATPGRYIIRASASAICQGVAVATALRPDERNASILLRVTPPAAAGLRVQEDRLLLWAGRPAARDIELERGYPVMIDPQTGAGVAIPSYVRISSPTSSVRLDGHSRQMGVRATLNPLLLYDLLVIPDAPIAPAFYGDLTPAGVAALRIVLDEGTQVSGRLSARGAPLLDARVVLRAGPLPSTVATSVAGGRFELRGREGSFDAVLLPPAGSGLPEAHLPDAVTLSGRSGEPVTLDFAWTTAAATRAEIVVRGPDGATLSQPVTVRLRAGEDVLPSVGTATVDGLPVTARGRVRDEAVTVGDVATFAALPRARYRALLVPADAATGLAVTEAVADLSRAGATVRIELRLGARVNVTGRLTGNDTSGVQITATDASGEVLGLVRSAVTSATGEFRLSLDPGRAWRLSSEPTADGTIARAPLVTVTPGATDTRLDAVAAPRGLTLVGAVTAAPSTPQMRQVLREPVAGAVVQAFCLGAPPACASPDSLDTTGVRPLGEATTDPSGNYRMVLPDPGTALW
jgi:hypothetical protein